MVRVVSVVVLFQPVLTSYLVVSQILVHRALAYINRALGTPGNLEAGGVQEGSGKLKGSLAMDPVLMDLLLDPASRALHTVESIIGDSKVARPAGCQIATRFPEAGVCPDHLSGREWHTDGMRQGKRNPFSLLLGVALSSVREPFHGNFCVFRGSHHLLHKLQISNGRIRGVDDHREWSTATSMYNPWCKTRGTHTDVSRPRGAREATGVDQLTEISKRLEHEGPALAFEAADEKDKSLGKCKNNSNHWTRRLRKDTTSCVQYRTVMSCPAGWDKQIRATTFECSNTALEGS